MKFVPNDASIQRGAQREQREPAHARGTPISFAIDRPVRAASADKRCDETSRFAVEFAPFVGNYLLSIRTMEREVLN